MNPPAIEIDRLSLHFPKKSYALKNISAAVEPGQIIGLIGRNGAGKSTLLEALAGLLVPSSGHSHLLGYNSRSLPDQVRQQLGFVFQDDELFGWMKVEAHIDLVGSHYRDWDKARARDLVDRWSIPLDKRVHSLSRGQRQKLGILLAVVHQPDILLLDEPASALDPVSRRAFLAELVQLACDGRRSMVFSSHLLADIERLADHIWLLREGELVFDNSLDELKEGVIRLDFRQASNERVPQLPSTLRRIADDRGVTVIAHHPGEDALAGLEREFGAGFSVSRMNLEEIALELL